MQHVNISLVLWDLINPHEFLVVQQLSCLSWKLIFPNPSLCWSNVEKFEGLKLHRMKNWNKEEVLEMKQSQWQNLHSFYQKEALHPWAQNRRGAGYVRLGFSSEHKKTSKTHAKPCISVWKHTEEMWSKRRETAKFDLIMLMLEPYVQKEFCRFCMGTLTSAELPQDLPSQGHMQTSATLVTPIPLREGRKMFVFCCSYPKGSEKIFHSACVPICESSLACASGSL